MPFLSRRSSSTLVTTHHGEYENNTSSKETTNFKVVNSQTNAIDKDNEEEWSYGTEELLDALPKPWTRSLLYVLISFSTIVVPWSMLSKVDETGSARGRIEPLGATQKLDAQADGRVTDVKVREGETVKAGQVLLKIESDVLRTDFQQAQAKLQGELNHQKQLHLLKNQLLLTIRTQEQQNQSQKLEKLAQVEQVKQNVNALEAAYNFQKEEKLAKLNQVKQAIESSKATFKLAQVRLQSAQEKAPRYKKAFDDGVIPQDRLLEVEQSVNEQYQNLAQATSEVSRTESSLQEEQSSYQRTLHQAEAEIQQAKLHLQEQQRSKDSVIRAGELATLKTQEQLKDVQSQISTLQSQISQTRSEIKSLALQLEKRVVRSPIDGVIFELPIAKPGSVVQPGQKIAQIAPNRTAFVLKAQVPTQNSGFLKVGMPVKIKFDAYPFQEYGIIPGKIKWISPDSKIQDTTAGKIETFELEIALIRPYLQSGNKRIFLSPGQTATAEVIIRQRRVIDYILDPFKKLENGGVNM